MHVAIHETGVLRAMWPCKHSHFEVGDSLILTIGANLANYNSCWKKNYFTMYTKKKDEGSYVVIG